MTGYSFTALPSHFGCKVKPDSESGCWLWYGSKSDQGYGYAQFRGRRMGAHRVVYELLVGPIPEGLTIDHLCRTRDCVNPAHLEAVTQQVNVLRGISPAAARAARTHCVNGHEFTPENTYVRKEGWRMCRACHVERQAQLNRRKPRSEPQRRLLDEIRSAGVLYISRYGRYSRTVQALADRGLVRKVEPDHSSLGMDGWSIT